MVVAPMDLRSVLVPIASAWLAGSLAGCGGGGGGGTTTTTTPAAQPDREAIHVPGWPDAGGFPLSFGIKAHGMVFASGLQGLDFDKKKLVEGGIANETEQTLINLQALLSAAGSSLENVVHCSVSVADMQDYPDMNTAYAKFWPAGTRPSRVAAQVGLQGAGKVEIMCTATTNNASKHVVDIPGFPDVPFSPAVVGNRMLYMSGQVGMDATTHQLVGGGVGAQTTQALTNINATLAAANSSLDLVVACDVMVTNMADFNTMNEAYKAFWPAGAALPARICYQVESLALGALVEVKCMAALPHTTGEAPTVVNTSGFPSKGLPLSWAVRSKGMLYISGMQGWNLTSMKLVPGGAGNETEQTMKNIGMALEAAGASMLDVVACEVYLLNLDDVSAVNKAYAAAFSFMDPPARVAVKATGLAMGASVEIKCTAVLVEAALPDYDGRAKQMELVV